MIVNIDGYTDVYGWLDGIQILIDGMPMVIDAYRSSIRTGSLIRRDHNGTWKIKKK